MSVPPTAEPTLAVGLAEGVGELRLRLEGSYRSAGAPLPPGSYRARISGAEVMLEPEIGDGRSAPAPARTIELIPADPNRSSFELAATIGIGFHWQQERLQRFRGTLRLAAAGEGGLRVVNDVPLETYLRSVVGSEMSGNAPAALLRAHAIISRSWLLAQLGAAGAVAVATAGPAGPAGHARDAGERIRIYDRQAHHHFDVCADDHCQRYQGVATQGGEAAAAAVDDTRGLLLTHAEEVCDARFSKCCGGVTEGFRAAWQDRDLPYLAPRADAADPALPANPLTGEGAFRRFLDHPPRAFCDCDDPATLATILPDFDRSTTFFRWNEERDVEQLEQLIRDKAGIELGRLLGLEPVQRGPSGRLVRLRLVGERGTVVVGKELEIRRLLSPSHLRSSAFVAEPLGPSERPNAFRFSGAGWGHGVGLCQIGAALMATRGHDAESILRHYYGAAELVRAYR